MPTPPIERPRLITSPPPVIKTHTTPTYSIPHVVTPNFSSELILEQEEVKNFRTGFKEAFPRTWWVALLILGGCLINPAIGFGLGFIGAIIALFIFSSSNKLVLLGRWLGAGILPNVAFFIGMVLFTSLINPASTNEVAEEDTSSAVAPITSSEEIYQEPVPEVIPPTAAEEPAVTPVEPAPEPVPVEPVPVPVAPVQPQIDINYGTCEKANAAGKGNYIKGTHPEYQFYRDSDKDGIACEF